MVAKEVKGLGLDSQSKEPKVRYKLDVGRKEEVVKEQMAGEAEEKKVELVKKS